MGRPSKLTGEVQQKIVFAIANGNALETAAQYAGIDPSTLFRWMQKGKKGWKPYCEFRKAIEKARTEIEMSHVATIEQAKTGGVLVSEVITEKVFKNGTVETKTTRTWTRPEWTAAAWWLERQHSDKWGKKESVEITIRREAERLAKETGLDVDEIMAEAERLVKA